MRYALLVYGDLREWADQQPHDAEAELVAYEEYTRWLEDRGWLVGAQALQSTPSATTVRVRRGELQTIDGPFAETKEQLGGFYLVDCEDLDQAIEAAARIPAARGGSVEIRPVLEIPSNR